MIRIKLLSVGKTKEIWLDQAIKEYEKRLTGLLHFDFIWVKDDRQLVELAEKERDYICLDPTGQLLTSEEFATFVVQAWEERGARLTFIIGGPEGIPKKLKSDRHSISLSPMTFTHQMTRLILVEQIYRAIEINKKSNYHK